MIFLSASIFLITLNFSLLTSMTQVAFHYSMDFPIIIIMFPLYAWTLIGPFPHPHGCTSLSFLKMFKMFIWFYSYPIYSPISCFRQLPITKNGWIYFVIFTPTCDSSSVPLSLVYISVFIHKLFSWVTLTSCSTDLLPLAFIYSSDWSSWYATPWSQKYEAMTCLFCRNKWIVTWIIIHNQILEIYLKILKGI